MLAAIRRTKSVPVWLALIAALTVIGTLATVVVNSVVQSRASNSVSGSVQDKGHAVAGSGETSVTPAATATRNVVSAPPAAGRREAGRAGRADTLASAQSIASGVVPAAQTGGAAEGLAGSAPRVDVDHPSAASRAHLRAAANARAARRDAAIAAARGDGTLRADIARYNAERGAGFDRKKNAMPLRAASDARNLHSLWDEMPQTMSDIYRN